MLCPHPIFVLLIWVKFQMVTDSGFCCSHQCCTPGNDHSLQPLSLLTPQVVGTPQSNNKPLMAISILHCITPFLRIAFSMQVRSFACIVRTEIWRLELHESLTHTTKNGLFTATITLHVTYRCPYTGLSVNWADRYMNRFFH